MKRRMISSILAGILVMQLICTGCSTKTGSQEAADNAAPAATASPAEAAPSESAATVTPAEAAPSESTDTAGTEEAAGQDTKFTEAEQAVYAQAETGEGIINTFIGEKFCDHKVTDEESAMDCVNEVLDRIGGDETTKFVFESMTPNETGMKIVTLSQRAGQVLAYGAVVKLILNKDDEPIGLVSSIMPNVDIRDVSEWAVDDKEAEKIVSDQLKENGSTDKLVENATEQAIIPNPLSQGHYICVWVVYTFRMNKDKDDQAYEAHYVTAEGEYMYSIPVAEPGDAEAAGGQSAKSSFDFDSYEPDEITVTVELKEGKKEVTVPVLKDSKTGKTYLADAKRKILCADQAPFFYNDYEIVPSEVDGEVDICDSSAYYNMIRVWDYYDSKGWTGPDGEGTPTLCLLNYIDAEGKPEMNACYVTKLQGYQVFAWTRAANFGGCIDVVGHEYTHCVTTRTMTYNLYLNDPGAINEGYSDIMGNLIEMQMEGEDEEGAWLIAEDAGKPFRNMSDPHEYAQPAFAWDTYYAPQPKVATGMNDKGGVHINNSLLSLVSYRLHQAGMSARDQAYYWLNTAIVISPQSDYPMMAEILPWVMRELGYEEYVDPLKAAIEEMKFTVTESTGEIPEGCGVLSFDFAPVKELSDAGRTAVQYFKAPDADPFKRVGSWAVPGTTAAEANLPVGDYYVLAGVSGEDGSIKKFAILGKDGWVLVDDYKDSAVIKANGITVSVKEGEKKEVPNEGFKEVSEKLLKVVEEIEASLE